VSAAIDRRHVVGDDDAEAPRPWRPHRYMVEAVKFLVERGAAALFLDPGLGKTSIFLAAFKVLRGKRLARQALVICPLRPAYSVWPAEARKWTDFHDLRVVVLHGPKKDRLFDESASADVLVINPEGLPWLFDRLLSERRRAWPDVLNVDESTMYKHTNTKRFKLIRAHLHRFRRRYVSTGTPAPNGLLDLFGQVYLLDQGAALGRYVTHFREEYFFQASRWLWVPKRNARERIQKAIAPLALRLDAEDHLDLPPRVDSIVKVDLPPRAARAYAKLEADLVVNLERGAVVAKNAGVLTSKCRQVANGAVYLDEDGQLDLFSVREGPRAWEEVHAAKLDALEDLLAELSGQPTIVAVEFHHDVDRIRERLGDVPAVRGGTTPRAALAIERDWNRGLLSTLLVQPQSGARGLNLQRGGRALIWYSMTWDLELHDQMVRRIWRQGQTKRVFVHYLAARGTVDEDVLAALRAKGKTQKDLLDALKARTGGGRKR
jgi:SNF2 family DNA or RNA helicase